MKISSIQSQSTTKFSGVHYIEVPYKEAPKIFSPAKNAYFEMLKINWNTHVPIDKWKPIIDEFVKQ